MLIIEAKNSSQWLHNVESLVMLPQLFGPVMRHEVLLEVSISHINVDQFHALFAHEFA